MPQKTKNKTTEQNNIVLDDWLNFAKQQMFSAKQNERASALILRELKQTNSSEKFFSTYTRKDIINAMKDITKEQNAKILREASLHLYAISSQFRRLVEYFATMPLFYYTVIPTNFNILNTKNDNYKQSLIKGYNKVLEQLENMNIRHEFLKITSTVFLEDVFFGYEYSTKDNYFILKLPSEYCKIVSMSDGLFQFAFNLSYFDKRKYLLDTWGEDWNKMYNAYKADKKSNLWQTIPLEKSICIKLNENIPVPIVPFLGVFEEIYDIQDYKLLKKVREEIGNYKLVNLIVPMNEKSGKKDDFLLDRSIVEYYYNLVKSVAPDNIGVTVSPMKMEEVEFKQDTSDKDKVAEAESKFWNSAGVSEFLFNSQKATADTLAYAITSDEMVVFKLLRQMERWLNYKLKQQQGKIKFKVSLLDITHFNKDKVYEKYLKSAQFGLPTKLLAGASLGLTNMDMDAMLFIENDILELNNKLIPLSSSHTQSNNDAIIHKDGVTDEGGRPSNKNNDNSIDNI